MIIINNISKTFKRVKKEEGLGGSIKSLFSREYVTIKAVKDVSININDGEIIGFLGPNGAGKSTTIKMMTGILKPDTGEININGFMPFNERSKYVKKIGVVFGQRSQLWWELPVVESFKILKEIYEVSDEEYNENIEMFDKLLNIKKLFPQPIRSLSLGQRMLCDIAATFLHNPKVVFLDEPTIGLDVSIKSKIREVIYYLNKSKGTTIILTTHDIDDIKALCKRIIIIDKGTMIYDGDINEISSILGERRALKVNLEDIISAKTLVHLLNKEYVSDKLLDIKQEEDWVNIEIDESKVKLTNIMSFILENIKVLDIKMQEPDIEVVMKKIYEGGIK